MTTNHTGGRAIVIGAGIAGLLAARALHESYDEVVILDRDTMSCDGAVRRGVPQGAHAHALLARGQQLLERRFPGLTAELVADGAAIGDALGDVRMHLNGHRLRSTPTGLTALSASRAFLERHVRQRVTTLPRIAVRDGCDVVGLSVTDDRRRVTGVRTLRRRDSSAEERLDGDAVVDASGRLTRLPSWLSVIDVQPPVESRVPIDLTYASRRYRLDRDTLEGDIAIVRGMTPDHPRGGVVAALENGTGIMTVAGLGEDHPPTDPDGFVEFAGSLGDDVGQCLRRAEPLDDPVPFRFPASTRRSLPRGSRWPSGLAHLGDSHCSLNPVYGQGMTLAALGAEALHDHVRRHGGISPTELQRRIAASTAAAWEMVTGADLALPAVPGEPSPSQRLLGRYVRRLHAAAATDPVLAAAFTRVAGLVDPPSALTRPAVVWRTLTRTGAGDRSGAR